VLSSVSQIEDNFNTVRASIGSRLSEVDDLDSVGQNLDLQYNQTLSNLKDLDYASAVTTLTRQQSQLQAAQLSFTKISQLSLFDYLK
jgi:flagellar hook-associated protein 3 FlgL